MRTTVRRALVLGAVALAPTACSDERPAPTAAAERYSPEVAARLAAEQARIDSVARRAMTGEVVTNDGLLGLVGGLVGGVTGVVNGLTYTLLNCISLPYAASTRVIGPNGGSITAGRHTLVIPEGALTQDVVVTAESPVGSRSEVRFSPHGLQFEQPAALTMSYGHCSQPSGYVRGLVYLDEGDDIVEAPPSLDIVPADRVVGRIDHFSGYAVAHTRIRE